MLYNVGSLLAKILLTSYVSRGLGNRRRITESSTSSRHLPPPLSLSLSLSHTHTHTHSLCLPLSFCYHLTPFLSIRWCCPYTSFSVFLPLSFHALLHAGLFWQVLSEDNFYDWKECANLKIGSSKQSNAKEFFLFYIVARMICLSFY